MKTFGAIEAGGTKFVCGVGTGPHDLRTTEFPTGPPQETVDAAIDFLRREAGASLAAVGIGSFGPIDLTPGSGTYGFITTTPKPGWQQTNLARRVGGALNVPVAFDTDVNAAAFGEARWGAAQDVPGCLYLTVGTGIGGGAIVNRQLLHGMTHPEMGHIRVPHDLMQDPFPGRCPFHRDCLEGLASGPAIRERWGKPAEELPAGHAAWPLEARYLAIALADFVCTLSPCRIILGGGVMQHRPLLPMIRTELVRVLAGYLQIPQLLEQMDRYVVTPELGNRSGVLGALALAERAVSQ